MDYSVFDSLFDSAIVIDSNRTIVYCNEAAAALAGSSVRRLTRGVTFSDIYNLADSEMYPATGGEVGRDQAAPMREIQVTTQNGSRVGKQQVTIQPFKEGSEDRWLVLMHDVTLEETLHVKYQGELEQKEVYIQELQNAKSQLEDYSKNLEKKVQERTAEVRSANRMLSAIMNSLGQGFLVFDRVGVCSEIYTKACTEILECVPAGMPISQVLKMNESESAQFATWIKASFEESLPFDSMVELAPALFSHSEGRRIVLSFYPIRDDADKITNIVLVATDRTREFEAEEALKREKQYIQMVLKVIKGRDQFEQFLQSSRRHIDNLKLEIQRPADQFDFSETFRILHTLEGEAGLFSVSTLRDSARLCQEILEPFKSGDRFEASGLIRSLKEGLKKLESDYLQFFELNGDLLKALRIGAGRKVETDLSRLVQFSDLLHKHTKNSEVLKFFNVEILQQPLEAMLSHYDEVVQHIASVQGKQVAHLRFECDGIKVTPGVFDSLFAALVHAFRNAVDHGIETPDQRIESGKDAVGHIVVRAEKRLFEGSTWIRLVVQDDGQGIQPQIIRTKLSEKQLSHSLNLDSDQDVIQGIFLPGFSSRDSVGQFSGRGIGMDAIKTEVERMGGKAWVESKVSMGTTLFIEFPESPIVDSVASQVA